MQLKSRKRYVYREPTPGEKAEGIKLKREVNTVLDTYTSLYWDGRWIEDKKEFESTPITHRVETYKMLVEVERQNRLGEHQKELDTLNERLQTDMEDYDARLGKEDGQTDGGL